jgi:hypothetical protein
MYVLYTSTLLYCRERLGTRPGLAVCLLLCLCLSLCLLSLSLSLALSPCDMSVRLWGD